jgi:hypothetical protein
MTIIQTAISMPDILTHNHTVGLSHSIKISNDLCFLGGVIDIQIGSWGGINEFNVNIFTTD